MLQGGEKESENKIFDSISHGHSPHVPDNLRQKDLTDDQKKRLIKFLIITVVLFAAFLSIATFLSK